MKTDTRTSRSARMGVTAVIALLIGIILPGPAVAGTRTAGLAPKPVLEFITPVVAPGGHGEVDINALGAKACELSFSDRRHGHAGPFVVQVHHRHVQWSWRVPRRAAQSHWSARVACARSRPSLKSGHQQISELLVVRGGRHHGRAGILAPGSLRVHVTARAPKGYAAPSGGKTIGLGSGRNPFTFGQCTYHAYEDRPDIYDYAVAHGVPGSGTASGARFGGIPDYWWNAWRWLSNAQHVGIPTGTTPVRGALVVFPRGYGGSAVGHVAYVEGVNPDGTYLVSERNWNWNPNVTERLVHPGYPGVGFIYGGQAGNGPTPPPPAPTPPPTSTTPTPPPTTPPPPAPAPTYYVHHVYGTCADGACGLRERTGPGYSNYAIAGVLSDGQEVDIVCQTQGQLVSPNHGTSSDVWDKLTNNTYVTDVYVDTSGVGGSFSPPIPQC